MEFVRAGIEQQGEGQSSTVDLGNGPHFMANASAK